MDEYRYYVYVITNTILNKKYIGCRITKLNPEDDNYMGSSRYLKQAYKEYGRDKFKKEIVKTYKNGFDMLNGEVKHILKYDTLEPRGYNRMLPSLNRPFKHKIMSEETKRKISAATKGRVVSEESMMLRMETLSKRTKEEQQIINEKISKGNKGKTHSEETKRKISISEKNTKRAQKTLK